MKVKPSVKKICDKCKVIRRHGRVMVICDNLRHNGERFRKGLLEFVGLAGDAVLREWVETNTTCPNAMVDRITPRPPPELRPRSRSRVTHCRCECRYRPRRRLE